MKLSNALISLAKAEGQRETLAKAVADSRQRIDDLTKRSDHITQAILTVQTIANELQADLTAFFTSCVQSALDIVFPGSYQFKMKFESRRNQAELDMWLDRNGEKVPPLEAAGGGVVDVIAFALRTCCLLLSKNRKVLFLDEPFKFIRGDARTRLGDLLNLLAVESKVQVVMVADVAGAPIDGSEHYHVDIHNGVSVVGNVNGKCGPVGGALW